MIGKKKANSSCYSLYSKFGNTPVEPNQCCPAPANQLPNRGRFCAKTFVINCKRAKYLSSSVINDGKIILISTISLINDNHYHKPRLSGYQ